ncbi:UDP-galactose transporter like protein 1 [Dictyocoela muelleri]|nr:UDP-galactose transporter like protein 1 [Dictyocoela muelleri]
MKDNNKTFSFILHSLGLYIIYIIHNILQEHLLIKNKSLSLSIFILFIHSIIGYIYAFLKCPKTININSIALKKSYNKSLYSHKNSFYDTTYNNLFKLKKLYLDNKIISQYIRISIFKMIYTLLSYTLIKTLSYPTLMILKSSKVIPLVLFKCVVEKKRNYKKILKALLITIGVYMFVINDKKINSDKNKKINIQKNFKFKNFNNDDFVNDLNSNSKNKNNEIDKNFTKNGNYEKGFTKNEIDKNFTKNGNYEKGFTKNEIDKNFTKNGNYEKSLLPSFLIFTIMISIDTLKNHIQDMTFKNYNIHFYHMMYFCNLIIFIITFIILIFSHKLIDLVFLVFVSDRILLFNIFIFSILNVLGQAIIYSMIQKFGTINVHMIVVTRKVFSLLISIFFFKHEIGYLQVFSLFLVFGSIGLDILI